MKIMARFQYAISILLHLVCLCGLFGIGRLFLIGEDALTWIAFGMSIAFGLLARMVYKRMPHASVAKVRVRNAMRLGEIPSIRRYVAWWFDWPLYDEIRGREVVEMFTQPSVSVKLTAIV